jgi:hypothetical protein
MSDLRRNGGGMPPDEGGPSRGGLPDLPPEWGSIVIPDDAAELDAEAYEVRRELRARAWRTRVGALIGLRPGRHGAASVGVPVVIMVVAVFTTLLSLFVVTWDHRRNATAPVGPEAAALQSSLPIADVTLTDAAGARVRLGNLLPAILLLADGCDCDELIEAIAAATPKPITVVPVGATAACAVGTIKNVWCLADPGGVVTSRYPSPAQAAATTADAASAEASAVSAEATATPGPGTPSPSAPPPMALAVPVDAHGTALEPILTLSPADLAEVLATLAG